MATCTIVDRRKLGHDHFNGIPSGVSATVIALTDGVFRPTADLLKALLVDLAHNNYSSVIVLGDGRFPDPSGYEEMGAEGILFAVNVRTGEQSESDLEAYIERLVDVLNNPRDVTTHITKLYYQESMDW